jgi:PhnB protein
MLAVRDAEAAIRFYQVAFGAELLWRLGDHSDIVAGLSIDGAELYLASESPEFGTRGPDGARFTTVRIELFVENPVAVYQRAISHGGKELNPVTEDRFEMSGPRPIRRILQGALLDPFGHIWLVGKILE